MDPTETYAELEDLLFAWSTPHADDSLSEVSSQVLHRDDGIVQDRHERAGLVRVPVEHELELRVVAGVPTLSGTGG